jgi:inner membrane protein YidH
VDVRHLLANERTLLAWVRTGLALMAFGFVIDRMALWFRFEGHTDERFSMFLGGAMIALGIACPLIGIVRFRAMQRALRAGQPVLPGLAGPIVVAVVVTLLALALLLYLLVGVGPHMGPRAHMPS